MYNNIDDWLQPQHSGDEGMLWLQSRAPLEFADGVLLDSFLAEDKVDRLFRFVESEAVFASHYKIRNQRLPVSEDVFFGTPEADRFLYRRRVAGVKSNFDMSPNWLIYRFFLEFCQNTLPDYLRVCSNCELKLESQVTHSHSHEHFLKSHSDEAQGRKLCVIFYLTKGWNPEDGGQLVMEREDGNHLLIEATYNRFAIFVPSGNTYHYVARHTEQAKAKNRICHVAWYKEAVDDA